jgi:hypothetical protein
MVISAVDAIGTAAPCKEETKESSSFFVKKVCSSVADIKLWVASSEGGFFVFFVFRTNIFAVPEVVFFVSLLIRIIVSQRGLDLLTSRSLECVSKLQIFFLLNLDELFRYVLVNVVTRFCSSSE